jgi:hypothetical protein
VMGVGTLAHELGHILLDGDAHERHDKFNLMYLKHWPGRTRLDQSQIIKMRASPFVR